MDDKQKKPAEQVPVTTQEETPVESSEETAQTPEPETMQPIPTQETEEEETKTTEEPAPDEGKPTSEETQPATEAEPKEKPSDEAPAPEAEPTPEDDQPVAEAEEVEAEPETAQPAENTDTTSETEPTEKEETNEPAGEAATDSEPEEKDEAKTEEEKTEDADTSKDDTASETPAPTPTPRDESGARWYVVHTYSGHENKVAATLKQRIESEHLQNKIVDILVPMQDKIEIRGGKKVEMKEKIFPGYILVKMILDDTTWLAVRTTQGVTSFVGFGNKPTPISDEEVKTIVQFTQIAQPTFKQVFSVDDTVKIVDGPFAEFIGKIDSVDEEKGKVRVLVSIFGRETPVELDFLQVQKI